MAGKPRPRVEHPDNAKNLRYKFISLTQGQYARVDADLFEKLTETSWFALWCKATQSYYAATWRRCSKGRHTLPLHRHILELRGVTTEQGQTVDHKNHDTLDCTTENLRPATRVEQSRNKRRRKHNTSGFIGVDWSDQHKRWRARAWNDGKRQHLGLFDDPFSAAWVRDEFVRREHGEFASLNQLVDRRSKRP